MPVSTQLPSQACGMNEDQIDPIAVLAALGVAARPSSMQPVGGEGTAVWRVEQGGATYALRLFREGDERLCAREAAVMRAVRAGGLPVPEVVASGAWEERPALLLSWCPGRTLAEAALADPRELAALARAAAATFARLHRLPAPAVLLEPCLDWVAQAGPGEAALQERVRALSRRPAALLHCDYHPENLLTRDGAITGVIDWTNARAGDPRADVARSIVLVRAAGLEMAAAHDPRGALVAEYERAFLEAYQEETGPLEELEAFCAWAWAMTAEDYAYKRVRPGFAFQEARLAAMQDQLSQCKRAIGLNG
jgi:aminoglycoside phosphotransferase (APT) family kinase protein